MGVVQEMCADGHGHGQGCERVDARQRRHPAGERWAARRCPRRQGRTSAASRGRPRSGTSSRRLCRAISLWSTLGAPTARDLHGYGFSPVWPQTQAPTLGTRFRVNTLAIVADARDDTPPAVPPLGRRSASRSHRSFIGCVVTISSKGGSVIRGNAPAAQNARSSSVSYQSPFSVHHRVALSHQVNAPGSRKRAITRSRQKTISDSAPPTTSAEAGWIVPGYGILPW
jgi:hypothetical protein